MDVLGVESYYESYTVLTLSLHLSSRRARFQGLFADCDSRLRSLLAPTLIVVRDRELCTGVGQKVSIVYSGTISSRACWSGVPPFQERREDVCAQSTVKTRSKNIAVVMSNGRVTDTTSAETNLASHLTSCACGAGAWSKVSRLVAAPL